MATIISESSGKQGFEVLLCENEELMKLLQRTWQEEKPLAEHD